MSVADLKASADEVCALVSILSAARMLPVESACSNVV